MHVLIETHGALREVWEIAALPGVESPRLRPDGFRLRPPRRHPRQRDEEPRPVRTPADRPRQMRDHRGGAGQRRRAVAQRHDRTEGQRDHPRRCPPRPRPSSAICACGASTRTRSCPSSKPCAPISRKCRPPPKSCIAAQDKDWGPIQHAGKLHDRASYRYYWELLDRAHVTGMEIPAEAESSASLPEELTILYRDEHIVVIDKPAGLLVHRCEIDRHETRFAMQILRDQIGQRVWPAHRLDSGTSGVLLFASSPEIAGDPGRAVRAGNGRQKLSGRRARPPAGGRDDRPCACRASAMTTNSRANAAATDGAAGPDPISPTG